MEKTEVNNVPMNNERDLIRNGLTEVIEAIEQFRNDIVPKQPNFMGGQQSELLSFLDKTVSTAKHFRSTLANGTELPQLGGDHSMSRECSLGVIGTPTSNEASSSFSQLHLHAKRNKRKLEMTHGMEYEEKAREKKALRIVRLEGPHEEDGYRWWKYGHKSIFRSMFPREYYRCKYWYHSPKLCYAKKQVQKTDEDPSVYQVTYKSEHTCGVETRLDTSVQQLPQSNQLVTGPIGEETDEHPSELPPLAKSNQQEISLDFGLQIEAQPTGEENEAQLIPSSFNDYMLSPSLEYWWPESNNFGISESDLIESIPGPSWNYFNIGDLDELPEIGSEEWFQLKL